MSTIKVTESGLKNIIKEAIEESAGAPSEFFRATKKWIMWCYNFSDPNGWVSQIWGDPRSNSMGNHIYQKFIDICNSYGSEAAMNRFFVELDSENQEKLFSWVMDNFRG